MEEAKLEFKGSGSEAVFFEKDKTYYLKFRKDLKQKIEDFKNQASNITLFDYLDKDKCDYYNRISNVISKLPGPKTTYDDILEVKFVEMKYVYGVYNCTFIIDIGKIKPNSIWNYINTAEFNTCLDALCQINRIKFKNLQLIGEKEILNPINPNIGTSPILCGDLEYRSTYNLTNKINILFEWFNYGIVSIYEYNEGLAESIVGEVMEKKIGENIPDVTKQIAEFANANYKASDNPISGGKTRRTNKKNTKRSKKITTRKYKKRSTKK